MQNSELKSFVNVCVSAIISLCYCYFVSASVPKGLFRFLSLVPVIVLFTTLPLGLSSIHLSAAASYYLAWLATFKLALFSVGQGPLSPPLPLLHFICTASLPIEICQNPHPTAHKIISPSFKTARKTAFFIKVLALAALLKTYNYRQFLHPKVALALYGCHAWLLAELFMSLAAAPARAIGLELKPQFNEPHLTTSLQDFWGRRWNLVTSSILRTTIYRPVRRFIDRTFGPRWAQEVAMIAAFTVSGFMHEVMYYHMTRVNPTWEVTRFFVLHGVCTAAEVTAKKKAAGRWQLPPSVTRPATMVFVAVTSSWLCFRQPLRNHVHDRVIGEYSVFVDFLREKMRAVTILQYDKKPNQRR